MKKLIIVGAGGHAKSIAETVLLDGSFSLVGFVDDCYPEKSSLLGYPILGTTDQLNEIGKSCEYGLVAIGNNSAREYFQIKLESLSLKLPVIIHPSAYVSPSAKVGSGSVIFAGAIIGADTAIGEGVIVNCASVIDHDCNIQNFVHLGIGVNVSGGVQIKSGAWIKAGSSLGQGVSVSERTILEVGTALI